MMARLRILLVLALTLTGFTIAMAPAASAATPTSTPAISYYVSLGDSLAQGIQPNPTTGQDQLTSDGYPDQLFHQLKMSSPGLRLVKFGCPGESTSTMIHGGICPYAVSQLADSVQFLRAHRGHIAYLTINIGSNDVLPCVSATTGIDATCVQRAITTAGANLATILGTLQANLNGAAVTAGMTYYDPILAVWLTGQQSLARQSALATNALNAVEAVAYLHFGFRVAPVGKAFHTNNFAIPAHATLPVNVTSVCSLTWMCKLGNIHPNTAGYALIAATFARTVSCGRRV